MTVEIQVEMTVDTTAYSLHEWQAIAPVWAELAEASRCSIFLTAPWVETWLETFAGAVEPTLLLFRADRQVVGASLLTTSGPTFSHPLRRIAINASGESSLDSTYIEFNDVLARPAWKVQAAEALARYALDQTWEEFALDGFCPGAAYEAVKDSLTGTQVDEVEHPSYFVDLASLLAAGLRYDASLGSRHRKHLQQNLRYHAQQGELTLQAATSTANAIDMFEELSALNRRRRETLGRPCVFSSDRFVSFHRNFIRKTFAEGRVQLLRVMAGPNTIGLVYNLVHRGKVYFYQCGYNYTADKRLSPGTVTLALVIQHCLEQGHREFDFLSGEAPYKSSMSTGSRSLLWTTFRRPGARVWAYEMARGLKHKFSSSGKVSA